MILWFSVDKTENYKTFNKSKQNISVKNDDVKHKNDTNEFFSSNVDFETSTNLSKEITEFNNFETNDFENSNLGLKLFYGYF